MTAEIIHLFGGPRGGNGGNGEEPPRDYLHMSPAALAEAIKTITSEELTHVAHALVTVVLKEEDLKRRQALFVLQRVVIDEHRRRRNLGAKGITPVARSEESETGGGEDEKILESTITAISRLLSVDPPDSNFRTSLIDELIKRGVDPVEANAKATQVEFALGLLNNPDAIHDVNLRTQRVKDFIPRMKEVLEMLAVDKGGERNVADVQPHVEESLEPVDGNILPPVPEPMNVGHGETFEELIGSNYLYAGGIELLAPHARVFEEAMKTARNFEGDVRGAVEAAMKKYDSLGKGTMLTERGLRKRFEDVVKAELANISPLPKPALAESGSAAPLPKLSTAEPVSAPVRRAFFETKPPSEYTRAELEGMSDEDYEGFLAELALLEAQRREIRLFSDAKPLDEYTMEELQAMSDEEYMRFLAELSASEARPR